VEDGFVATVEDENSGGNTITQKRTQKAQEPNPKAQTQYTRISDPSEHTPPRAHALTRTGLRERERGRDSGSPPWPAVLTRGREGEIAVEGWLLGGGVVSSGEKRGYLWWASRGLVPAERYNQVCREGQKKPHCQRLPLLCRASRS
jgi:hypothetical protein